MQLEFPQMPTWAIDSADDASMEGQFPEFSIGVDTYISGPQLAAGFTVRHKEEGVILSSAAIPVRTPPVMLFDLEFYVFLCSP